MICFSKGMEQLSEYISYHDNYFVESSERFSQVAKLVTKQISQILHTQVFVIDHHKKMISSSDTKVQLLTQSASNAKHTCFTIPIQVEEQAGEIFITKSQSIESTSPQILQELVELITHQAYVLSLLPKEYELKNKFIHDLLRGESLSELEILREGELLGMDLTRPRTVILIDASNYIFMPQTVHPEDIKATQIWEKAQSVIRSIVRFFHLPNDTICAYIGNGEIAVLKASSTNDLASWADRENKLDRFNKSSWANLSALKQAGKALLKHLEEYTQVPIGIGLGRYHAGIRGLSYSYQDARAALSLGVRCFGKNRVYCLDELGIAAFVGISDQATKMDLAKHLLSPLDQEQELIETLLVFFDKNCCASATANKLMIHRNTLNYRLEKVTTLTGLDPRRFDSAIQIRLALLLRSLKGNELKICYPL